MRPDLIHAARKSASRAVLGRMQLTLHATRRIHHDASKSLVVAISAWPVKTRRAPPRHYRDARVYGHTTTAMYDHEYPPPLVWSLRELDNQGTVFALFFGGRPQLVVELDHLCEVKNLYSAHRN